MSSSPKNGEAARAPASHRVLVVEDDPASRSFLQFALAKHGYGVTTAEDGNNAKEHLATDGVRNFDCVVTDYRMPDCTGLELLAWIKGQDPSLATIIVTAEGERALVTESLRGGAVDFLDKPIDLKKLRAAVSHAIQQTQRQRRLADSDCAVQRLGLVQERMLGADGGRSPVRVEVCFHPKYEAGGDFFSRFQPEPGQAFCLLTDVSGHDVQAAYISAYFQGIVRGMLEHSVSVEDIFVAFNRLLLEEWNHAGKFEPTAGGIEASIAACALLIDSTAQIATVLAQGMPAPVYWLPDGDARIIGESGGFPLGWSPEFSPHSVILPIPDGGSFCLWTDGLQDFAEQAGVSELSLAWALQSAKGCNHTLAGIESATDDILLADIHLSPGHLDADSFRPLILEQYHGGQTGEIDELQAFWERSLMLAAPELPPSTVHDVLLASREALLNALQHGCGGRAGQRAGFQIAYCRSQQTIRARVCDSGPGHHFNLAEHESFAAWELAEAHRGLILVRHLASGMDSLNNGASLKLDFAW